MKNKPIISLPPKNDLKRFVLGKEGKNCLLVVCLNPSTADINGLDDTTRNVEKIAIAHGNDGWILFNLSAQRSTDPNGMHHLPIDPFHNDNSYTFSLMVDENEYGFKDVLFAWGNNIEKRDYLKTAALELIEISSAKKLNSLQIRLTQKGHPCHPASQALSRHGGITVVQLSPFNINQYRNQLK